MIFRHYLTLVFSFVAWSLFFSSDASAQSYGDYYYRKKLVLNTDTYVSGSSDLLNFPILLSITDTDLIRTGGGTDKLKSANAYDIAFTDASDSDQTNTTEYKYQIESYNASTGELKVWVRIPTLKHNSNNEVYFYFGSTTYDNNPTASDTWASDYKAVYHFNESAYSTDANAIKDGKGAYNATLTSSSNNLTTGFIGGAYTFNGSNQHISSTDNVPTPNTTFTLSAWVKITNPSNNQKIITNQYPYSQGHGSLAGRGFKMGIDGSKPEAEVTGQRVNTGSALSADQWYYMQTVFTGNNLYNYVNGVLHSSGWGGSPTVDGFKLRIGIGEGLDGYRFAGIIDEVRVSDIAKSADWLATEYNNQRYPGHGGNGTGLSGGYPFIHTYGDLEIVNTPPIAISDIDATTNSIAENSTAGTVTGITAYASFDVSATVTYSLSVNPGDLFSINSSTGVVTVASSNFDYETNTSHDITVAATDGTSTIYQTFTIAVRDIFDSFSSSYLLQKTITLNNALLGISGNLTNYPVLLKIQDNNLIPGVATCGNVISSSSNPDVAFIDPDNPSSELNYEIESYNSTTGTLYVWVKLPTLKSSGTNTLYMYFGTATPSVAHTSAFTKATWTGVTGSLNSFKGVWHFNENPASTSVLDATSVGNNLNQSTGASLNSSSLIGNGVTLSNGALYKTGVSGLPASNSSQTISFWAHYTSTPGNANMVSIQNAASSSSIQMGTRNSGFWTWYWGGNVILYDDPKPDPNVWHHYVYSYDSSGNLSKLYIDGALITSGNSGAPSGTPNAISFGSFLESNNSPGTGERFTGSIDEAQIIDAVLSADWVKANYVIQSNPAAFINNGAVDPIYSNTSSLPGALVYTWTGVSSTDGNDAANWTNTTTGVAGQLPLSNGYASVIIPAGLSRYPTLSADLSAYGLTIASGASLSLNGYQLNVKCNFYNSGSLFYSSNLNSSLAFNGAVAEQIYQGSATNAEVGNLTIANTGGDVSLIGGVVDVYGLLTLSNNTLNTNNFLTLKATSTNTAGVAAIPDGVSINGNMNVEAYFSGGSSSMRGTRSISSPMNETLSGLTTYQQLKNYIIITGPGGSNNGFDPGGPINPEAASLTRYYEPATNAQSQFAPVSNITDALPAGYGVFLYFRGNRDGYDPLTSTSYNKLVAPFADPENTVVKYTGIINQGDITVNLSYTNNSDEGSKNGYNLIGNPYPAVIDWDDVDKVNLAENTIVIAKPTGGFAVSNDGLTIPLGMDLRYIQPGLAFYVKAAGSGASVTFKERNKVAPISTPSRLLSAPAGRELTGLSGESLRRSKTSASVSKLIRISLQDKSFTEEAVVAFGEGYSAAATKEDATFFGGSTVSLSTLSSDKVKLTINRLPLATVRTVIPVSVNALSSGDVKLNFMNLSAIENAQLYLVDKYLNKTIEINSTADSYSFTITKSVSSTFGDNRLELVISPPSVLPIELVSFNARANDENVKLSWATQLEKGSKEFFIEKSVNGTDFEPLSKIKAAGNSKSKVEYAVLDAEPVAGLNYYRLTLFDENDSKVYSAMASVNYTLAGSDLSVFPNPARDVLNIAYQHNYKSLSVEVISQEGKVLKKKTFSASEPLQLPVADIESGSYILQLKDVGNANVQRVQFIKY